MSCKIKKCPHNGHKDSPAYCKLFAIPTAPEKRNLWLDVFANIQVTNSEFLCCCHFNKSDIRASGRLRPEALPISSPKTIQNLRQEPSDSGQSLSSATPRTRGLTAATMSTCDEKPPETKPSIMADDKYICLSSDDEDKTALDVPEPMDVSNSGDNKEPLNDNASVGVASSSSDGQQPKAPFDVEAFYLKMQKMPRQYLAHYTKKMLAKQSVKTGVAETHQNMLSRIKRYNESVAELQKQLEDLEITVQRLGNPAEVYVSSNLGHTDLYLLQ